MERRLVLDSEAIAALKRFDKRAERFLENAERHGDRALVHAVVVAEVTRRHYNIARVNMVLRRVRIQPTTEKTARLAAHLTDRAGFTATVDAIVAAEAVLGDEAILLTGDYDDHSRLVNGYDHVRVLTV